MLGEADGDSRQKKIATCRLIVFRLVVYSTVLGESKMGTPKYRLWLMPMVALGVCVAASGQTVSIEILGLVTDATGAIVPGATVTARRVATGDVRTTISNETGNYTFPLLEVGEYEVSCSAAGFKTEVRRSIPLELQQKLRLDFQMQIGQ